MFQQEKLCNILLCDSSDTVDQDVFNFFIDYFGVSIAGHKEFNCKNRAKKTFSDICTPSDEAFLSFTLERCWDNWYQEFEHKEKISRKGKYAKTKSNQKYKGMKQDGISKFNELARNIKTNRRKYVRIDLERKYRLKYENLIKSYADDNESTYDGTYKIHKPKRAKIIAYTDLGNSEDENEHVNQNAENENKYEYTKDQTPNHSTTMQLGVDTAQVLLSKNKESYKLSSPKNKDRSKLAYHVEDSSLDRSCKFQAITLFIETYVKYFLLTLNNLILQLNQFFKQHTQVIRKVKAAIILTVSMGNDIQ